MGYHSLNTAYEPIYQSISAINRTFEGVTDKPAKINTGRSNQDKLENPYNHNRYGGIDIFHCVLFST